MASPKMDIPVPPPRKTPGMTRAILQGAKILRLGVFFVFVAAQVTSTAEVRGGGARSVSASIRLQMFVEVFPELGCELGGFCRRRREAGGLLEL